MNEPSNLFVVCLGVATVFIGLVCIILLCKIVSLICSLGQNKETKNAVVSKPVVVNEPIQNKQEIIAAVSAVIAEELGKDVSAIKVLSFKKI